jgi:tungstate transport system ATP-binding protein
VTTQPIMHTDGLVKRFGESFALRVDRLQICRGEVFCLLGPTGAGKSTLLNLLAGLVPACEGEVFKDGYAVNPRTTPIAVRRSIAMVHQRPLLLAGSVRTNVEYGLRIRHMKDRSERVDPVLQRLGLDGLAHQAARTLSGGQTQLVALARALVTRPDVLILDEPTANLDPARVSLVEQVIADAQTADAVTVIWATHNLFQARRMADRIGLLWNGQLVEVAATTDFFGSPADGRTADFVAGRLVY